jgi:baculoviral IAP repeat-containing protein 5
MFSYSRRLESFKEWPKDYGVAVPEKLAIVGYVCTGVEDGNLTAACVYCNKALEGWERTDEPVLEHYSHKKVCPLFNMQLHKNRMLTFKDWGAKAAAQRLARNGFIRYNLNENDFIFCYMCGSMDETHRCRERLSFDASGSSSVFFYNILRGKYNESIGEVLTTSVLVPQHMLKEVGVLVKTLSFCGVLGRTEDLIGEFMGRELEAANARLERDIEDISDALDREMERLKNGE